MSDLGRRTWWNRTHRPGKARRARRKARVAWRAWRAENILRPVAKDAVVTFVIPLIARALAYDWPRTLANLDRTLASLRAQSCQHWRAVICGQDAPALSRPDDRVQFLLHATPAVPFDPAHPRIDKQAKVAQAVEYVSRAFADDGYVFRLDADDLLHPELVDYMLRQRDESGYLIESGYMLDVATNRLAALRRRPFPHRKSRAFNRHCGSCSAVRADFRDGSAFLEPIRDRGKHRSQHDALAAYGIKLRTVPFPAALYLVNHGENMRLRRGRLDSKMLRLESRLVDDQRADEIWREFALDAVLGPRSRD